MTPQQPGDLTRHLLALANLIQDWLEAQQAGMSCAQAERFREVAENLRTAADEALDEDINAVLDQSAEACGKLGDVVARLKHDEELIANTQKALQAVEVFANLAAAVTTFNPGKFISAVEAACALVT